jgi:hypothetical protein
MGHTARGRPRPRSRQPRRAPSTERTRGGCPAATWAAAPVNAPAPVVAVIARLRQPGRAGRDLAQVVIAA